MPLSRAPVMPASTRGAARPVVVLSRAGRLTLVIAFVALLCLPRMSHQLRLPILAGVSENRAPVPAPGRPTKWIDFETWPTRYSAYLADHFGLRGFLLEFDGWSRYRLFGEFVSDQVMLGREKRLFLTSHTAGQPFTNIDRVCGVGVSETEVTRAARVVAAMLDVAQDIAPRSAYVSVPTAPIIYAEDLPGWLARRCAAHTPLAMRVQDALARPRPDLSTKFISPDAPELRAKAEGFAYLPWDFHWSGLAARAVTRAISEHQLGLSRLRSLPVAISRQPSDLTSLTVGISQSYPVWEPRYGEAGLTFCHVIGGSCDPAFTSSARVLREMTAAHRPGGSGPRLLILGDSFGQQAANYFPEYFDDVLFLNLAYERGITADEFAAIGAAIAARGRPDVFVLLFHDVALGVDLADVLAEIARGQAGGASTR